MSFLHQADSGDHNHQSLLPLHITEKGCEQLKARRPGIHPDDPQPQQNRMHARSRDETDSLVLFLCRDYLWAWFIELEPWDNLSDPQLISARVENLVSLGTRCPYFGPFSLVVYWLKFDYISLGKPRGGGPPKEQDSRRPIHSPSSVQGCSP